MDKLEVDPNEFSACDNRIFSLLKPAMKSYATIHST